jgi:adenylate cyclase
MDSHRQLAAILFTDIEGYSALMQKNEQQALQLRDRHREVLQQEHDRYYGRIIQYYGDGTLSTFPSAVEAVKCALAMQQAFRRAPQVPVRMGLHIGDIILQQDQAIGDGVNLAARVQSLGVAGSVLLSDKVNDEIHHYPELQTVLVGTYQFKNIARQVAVFALNHEGLVQPLPDSLQGKTAGNSLPARPGKGGRPERRPDQEAHHHHLLHSIAVLPFVNISNDPDQEYFSDGMTEDILNSLTQIQDLKVAGRTSSFQFKGKNLDLREVGNKLQVETVLEGSVRKQGNRVRVTAQLIDVEDGFHLWSERYDREMDDIFAIQDDISAQIAEQLKVNFFGQKCAAEAVKKPTSHMEAYDLYLKGRYWLEKTVEGIPKALACFKQAVELDPAFADAWSGLGVAYFQGLVYMFYTAKEGMEKSKYCAEKAIALDPDNGAAHILLGQVYGYYDLDWEKAGQELATGKECTCSAYMMKFLPLEPWFRGMIYGDFDFSIRYMQQAVEKDPLSIFFLQHLGYFYLLGSRQYPEARQTMQRILDLDARQSEAWRNIALAYLFEGRYELAEAPARKAYTLAQGQGLTSCTLILCLAAAGKKKEARQLYDSLQQTRTEASFPAVLHSYVWAWLGEMDTALNWLEKAVADHNFWLFSLKYSPDWDPMRPEPRFQKILDRIGFPEKRST